MSARLARNSSWTHLPVDVLQQITALLPRDGVASVAKVWPEAVEDENLRIFIPGGMPVCEVCFNKVASDSLPELLLHEDPMGFLAVLPEDDDLSTYMIHRDVVTLVVRRTMDLGCKQPDSGTCLLCLNKQTFQENLQSQEWQFLLSKYAHRLASELQEYSDEMRDLHGDFCHHFTNIEELLRCEFFPVVCTRCGSFCCDHGSTCHWFCGEGKALQQLQERMQEEHRVKVENMAPCGCNKTKKAKAGHRVCACQHCNSTPPKDCNFCYRCCRSLSCFHTQPPQQANIDHNFIKFMAT